MERRRQVKPPHWARRLLAWYCRPALLEDLEGDLNEYFDRNVSAKGPRLAQLIYILDILKFFRPYTVRKPEFLNLLIHWMMIASYVRTSGRSIVRNKLFSAINIVGLAISMSTGLLIIAMLTDVLSYDKFHENHDRIYRVISLYEYNGKKDNDFHATTSLKAATTIKESFASVEDVAILHRGFSGDVSFGTQTIPLSGLWTNPSFCNVFSFELLQGNPITALTNPFSIVLTEESAFKLFGNSDAMGQVVIFNRDTENEKQYTVTGILKDVPRFSHIQFDMLGSLSTRQITEAENADEMAWNNMWSTWAYVLLPDATQISMVKENLAALSAREDKTVPYTHIELDLQPLGDIMTGANLSNQLGETIGGTVLKVFGGLAFIVVLCAALNYTNLSIARSIRRSREVGIRKTIGARRGHVVNQFLVESVMISLLALVFGFGLFLLIKPHFLSIESSLQALLVLDLTPMLVLSFVLFAVLVGVCAGFFPALFYARINAIQVLKNLSAIPVFRGVTMRKVLIVFQYCISIMAITATLIFYQQYTHFVTYDLGFSTENILNIRLQGNKADLLKKGLMEMPEVKEISQSAMITGIGHYWGTNMKNPNDPHDSTGVNYNLIDENYIPLHDHQLLAGRNFQRKEPGAEETEVIVNQAVLKRFNLDGQDPEKAIGQALIVNRKPLTIIGVMKDFEYGKANNKANKEVVMRYSPDQAQYLNVKILSTDWPETYSRIESVWKSVDRVHAFQATLYDEQIENSFQGLKASLKVGAFLAFLVICIASIGLLGMVVYSTETRLREVSIRKVFGAGEMRLLYLLSRGFLWLLVIASAISLPITWLFFERILLPEIGNHAPLRLFEMSAGFLGVMLIAILLIGTQTLKIARANPAEVLKGE